jgi:hypothetical protein
MDDVRMLAVITRALGAGAAAVALLAVTAVPATAHDDGTHGHSRHRLTLLQRLCLRVIDEPTSGGTLTQTLQRVDQANTAKVAVTLDSPSTLRRASIVSCAFIDSDGNGAPESGERIQARIVHVEHGATNEFHYVRRVAADPASQVCVLSIALDVASRPRLLSSGTTCVVNPLVAVPESPLVALLGVTGLGTLGLVGLRRRRLATTV